MSTLYTRVYQLSQRKSLTIPQLADKIGVTDANIYSWKNSKNPNPSMETLRKLSIELNTSIDYLTGQTDQSPLFKQNHHVDLLNIPNDNRQDWISAGGKQISDDDWQVIQAIVSKYRN